LLNRSDVSGITGRLTLDAPDITFGAALFAGPTADLVIVGVNSRGTVRVLADSGITNAAELRAQLVSRGHTFQGATDAELIANVYEEWGPRGVARLRGPFACAVWDAETHRLVLARDHIGLRRIYYALLPDGGLAFASDIQQLLQEHGVSREWSPDGIDAYLAHGYVPAPLTAYRRISKLEPAQLLQVDGRRFRLEQYWDIPAATPASLGLDERLATLEARLGSALRRPIDGAGALIYSGSTASTVLLAASAPGGLVPVTVSVEEDASELTRSDAVASRLGHQRQLELAAPEATMLAAEFAGHVHEPIADPSAVVQLAVLRAVARHADSAFAAHGAAVMWAGHPQHPVERDRGRLEDVQAARRAYSMWDDRRRRGIYTRDFAWQVRDADPFGRHLALHAAHPSDDPLERALYVDLRTALADRVLASADRAAIAAGISLRFPFLDRDLVVLAATTPPALKRRGTTGLHALRRLLLPQLPRTLMPPARPPAARHDWLRTALPGMVPAMLLTPRFDERGIVSRVALRRIWDDHCTGRHDQASQLWSLLMLEFWFRQCIDGTAADEPLEYAVLKAVA
jgi:asparagine synthase (glutamine-hydrolysing)